MRTGPLCTHLPTPAPPRYLCIPLVAQGDALGVLYLALPRPRPPRPRAALGGQARGSPPRWPTTLGPRARQRAAPRGAAQPVHPRSAHRPLQPPLHGGDARARGAARPARGGVPMGVLMLDLDHFKRRQRRLRPRRGRRRCCARSGRAPAQAAAGGRGVPLRRRGVRARPARTPRWHDAARRAEQLRRRVKRCACPTRGASSGPCTVSIGVAAYPEHGLAGDALLHAADAALYRAKREGRDRVVIAEAEVPRSR